MRYISVDMHYISVDIHYISTDMFFISTDIHYVSVDMYYISIDTYNISIDMLYDLYEMYDVLYEINTDVVGSVAMPSSFLSGMRGTGVRVYESHAKCEQCMDDAGVLDFAMRRAE
jgi:hypothetical protein